MSRLLLIDGNSILNRAFYGIMGNKMLTTKDGKYTNAVYGFLAIMFKVMEELKPEYMMVTFDMKGPTKRHEMYKEYKANRHGMPDELAEQMPIIKEILRAMNIDIIEKQGYEGDDILGTLSVYGEKQGLEVTVLSGDRDNFQLATDKVTIRIPRTKAGKTEVEDFNREKIIETYGVEPKQLIEVKGLQGDSSDNIPGVPGIGEKTALSLIKKYGSIQNLYEKVEKGEDDLKGKQKENIVNNKELAMLSRELGTINLEAPVEMSMEELKVEEWNKPEVLRIFKELNFNRYIERFNLEEENKTPKIDLKELIKIEEKTLNQIKEIVTKNKKIFFCFAKENSETIGNIINKKITYIYVAENENVYYAKVEDIEILKEIFENTEIEKYGYKLSEDYILLKQLGIKPNNIVYDAEVAEYDIDPTKSKYPLEDVSLKYLNLDINEYLEANNVKEENTKQLNLFDNSEEKENTEKYKYAINVYVIYKSYEKIIEELKTTNEYELFKTIEMPLVEVLSEMQWAGMHIEKQELQDFGNKLKQDIDKIVKEIYELSGEEFNVNSPKQLGEVLFEKLKLPVIKKTKNGYSTDVAVLEKLVGEHPVIEKILEYRSLAKLNSTYVEGLEPYINEKTKRIHSYFHQTITATGRISSTEPNLQNIPTRIELGKQLRKVFKPEKDYVFIDADYSQIELRVLAHISEDENMMNAFKNGEDIHKKAASKVLGIPLEEVTKQQRSHAKAVNFGIVYGISDFGLAGQLGISKKEAKQYIESYLEKYSGIKKFMEDIVEKAKQQGYVETLFGRRRYIPELKSNNYMVRQFGSRVAMNMPIQGTAADIMKIAMIDVYSKLKEKNLKSRLILQIHDELIIEAYKEEKEEVKEILKSSMENAYKLNVPLIVDMCEADNWYDAK